MITKIITVCSFMMMCHSAFSQSLNSKELGALYDCVGMYLHYQEKSDERKGASEYVVCFLDVDSSGRIANINLLADPQNRDSVYSYLSRLSTTAFAKFKADKCKGKTIMLPVVVVGNIKSPAYIERLNGSHPVKRVQIESDNGNIILVSPLHHQVPVSLQRSSIPASK